MKTIFAFSDTHEKPLSPALVSVAEESDFVFFLGDGARGIGDLALHKGFYGVKGNCDFLPLPEEAAAAKKEGPAPIPANIMAAISAAVAVVTHDKGKVTKVEKLR